MQIQKVVRA
uniref:Uncharacterized protein n=1 Tax=Anguilla anguilla TaxID=7936 RepID=A0A0E9UFE0_ANGAN